MFLILMTYRILIKCKNISHQFITIFYHTYNFRYLSIYHKDNTEKKNDINNEKKNDTSDEENEDENFEIIIEY